MIIVESLLFYVAAFILGAILGSFLNVLAQDLEAFYFKNKLEDKKEAPVVCKNLFSKNCWQNFFTRRSHCDNCGYHLGFFDLFPVFSYLFLKGCCRSCEAKIHPRHFWAEIAAGFLFAEVFTVIFASHASLSGAYFLETGFFFVFFSLLFLLAVFDLRHQVIPNMLVYPAGVLALVTVFVDGGSLLGGFTFGFDGGRLLAGLGLGGLLAGLWLVSKGRWIGLADAKLAVIIGWLLGAQLGLSALALAFWAGALVGLAKIGWSKYISKTGGAGMQTAIAFGPFLIFGLVVIFVTGFNFFPLAM